MSLSKMHARRPSGWLSPVHRICEAQVPPRLRVLARPLRRSLHALIWGCAGAAAFDASYVLAFMLAGTFLVYAVLILVMRNVFVREEKEGKLRPNKADATAAGATTTTNAPAVRRLSCCLSADPDAKQQHSAAAIVALAQG